MLNPLKLATLATIVVVMTGCELLQPVTETKVVMQYQDAVMVKPLPVLKGTTSDMYKLAGKIPIFFVDNKLAKWKVASFWDTSTYGLNITQLPHVAAIAQEDINKAKQTAEDKFNSTISSTYRDYDVGITVTLKSPSTTVMDGEVIYDSAKDMSPDLIFSIYPKTHINCMFSSLKEYACGSTRIGKVRYSIAKFNPVNPNKPDVLLEGWFEECKRQVLGECAAMDIGTVLRQLAAKPNLPFKVIIPD